MLTDLKMPHGNFQTLIKKWNIKGLVDLSGENQPRLQPHISCTEQKNTRAASGSSTKMQRWAAAVSTYKRKTDCEKEAVTSPIHETAHFQSVKKKHKQASKPLEQSCEMRPNTGNKVRRENFTAMGTFTVFLQFFFLQCFSVSLCSEF